LVNVANLAVNVLDRAVLKNRVLVG